MQLQAFEKEKYAYVNLIPECQRFLEKAKISALKVPRCYNVHDEKGVLLLDNLKTEGFQSSPNKSGLK